MVSLARRTAAALLLGFFALLPPQPAGAANFTPEQRKELEGIIHDYLVKNPEVLLDALQAAEDKIKTDTRDKAANALVSRKREIMEDPESPVSGNPQGDVSVVEFFDYRCPYCKQVEPALETLLSEDRQVRLIYKELPVLGPDSTVAARAALAARKQGKYEQFHRALMTMKGQINEGVVLKVAGSVGIDTDRLKKDMSAPEIDRAIKANMELAQALDIRGTPAFIIGNDIIPGAMELSTMKDMVEEARKKR